MVKILEKPPKLTLVGELNRKRDGKTFTKNNCLGLWSKTMISF